MSRHGHTHLYFRVEREGRVAQMSKQEEVIARKRQEILEKQKTTELAKQVVAAQGSSTTTASAAIASAGTKVKSIKETITSVPMCQQKSLLVIDEPVPPKNNFNNDGSFLENFKKITEAAAKKAQDEKEKRDKEEAARKALEEESSKGVAECPPAELSIPNLPLSIAYDT